MVLLWRVAGLYGKGGKAGNGGIGGRPTGNGRDVIHGVLKLPAGETSNACGPVGEDKRYTAGDSEGPKRGIDCGIFLLLVEAGTVVRCGGCLGTG